MYYFIIFAIVDSLIKDAIFAQDLKFEKHIEAMVKSLYKRLGLFFIVIDSLAPIIFAGIFPV